MYSISSEQNNGYFKILGDINYEHLIIQPDGNLVIYNSQHKPIWASDTCQSHHKDYHANMQSDGNLVIYNSDNHPLWATNTQHLGIPPYILHFKKDELKFIIQDAENNIIYSSDLLI
jgi:hypothetical protein